MLWLTVFVIVAVVGYVCCSSDGSTTDQAHSVSVYAVSWLARMGIMFTTEIILCGSGSMKRD